MIRTSKKNSKQGVILVTVLFIFVIAMIFIATALMLTNYTRTRVYERAEKNQARLTVTAAAEAFYQALYMGDISDADILEWAATNDGAGLTLTLTDPNCPGMGETTDNCTTVTVKEGSEDPNIADDANGHDHYTFEFVTTIGDQTENVIMVLEYNPTTPPRTSPFRNMVETNGDSNLTNLGIGTGGAGQPTNTVLARGGLTLEGGNQATPVSTYIVLGELKGGDVGSRYSDSSFVLWGTDSYVNYTTGNSMAMDNLFFVNPYTSNVSATTWSYSPTRTCAINNEVYINRTNVTHHYDNGQAPAVRLIMNGSNPVTNGYTDNTGVATADSTARAQYTTSGTAAYTAYQLARSYMSQEWKDSIEAGYPDLSSAVDQGLIPNTLNTSEVPDSATAFAFPADGARLTPHTYVLNGSYESRAGQYCELSSGTYIFYVTGNVSFKEYVFYVKESASVSFILMNGASLTFWGDDAGCGIMSTPARTSTEAESNSRTFPSDAGSGMPNCDIYGVGNNKLILKRGSVVDAFVQFYEPSGSSTHSEFRTEDTNVHFYGRVRAPYVCDLNGAAVEIPYCPMPSGNDDPNRLYIHYSDFRIASFLYYY